MKIKKTADHLIEKALQGSNPTELLEAEFHKASFAPGWDYEGGVEKEEAQKIIQKLGLKRQKDGSYVRTGVKGDDIWMATDGTTGLGGTDITATRAGMAMIKRVLGLR